MKTKMTIETKKGCFTGDLFTQIRAYVSMPTNDGPRTLIVNTINNLVTAVNFLIELSSSIFSEFRKFEEGVTTNQAVLSDRLKTLKDVEAYFLTGVQGSTRASDKVNKQNSLNTSTFVDVS